MAKASQVVILENEFYIIKAPNGKVLEVKDFNTENGAAIQLWSYAGHPWQQWQFVDAGGGRWRIQNRFTGKVIDLALGGVVEGTWLHQWSRTNGWSQCWTLEPTRSGHTRIRNVLADKYIDLLEQGKYNRIVGMKGEKLVDSRSKWRIIRLCTAKILGSVSAVRMSSASHWGSAKASLLNSTTYSLSAMAMP